MFERLPRRTLAATGAAFLAAMGIGGAAIAQSNGASPAKTQATPATVRSSERPGVESTAPENSATDGDNVQYTAPGDTDYKGGRPGGHADEPGNANPDHQFQGQE